MTVSASPMKASLPEGCSTEKKLLSVNQTPKTTSLFKYDPIRFSELKRIARNAFVAFALRVLLDVVKRRRLSVVVPSIKSMDGLRWAAAVAGLSLHSYLERIGVPVLAAGLICGVPALALYRSTRTELAMYLLARCLHGVGVSEVLPRLPPALRDYPHYDTLSMCVTACYFLYAYTYYPKALSPAYHASLTRLSGLDWRVMVGVCRLYAERVIGDEIITLCWSLGTPIPSSVPPTMYSDVCRCVLHPGVSCWKRAVTYIPRHVLFTGIPLYLPLKVVSLLVFKPKSVVEDPLKALRKFCESMIRSSLFLAIYPAVAVLSPCVLARIPQIHRVHYIIVGAVTCSLAGVSVMVEPKARRGDLAMFCVMQCVRAYLGVKVLTGWLPRPTPGRVLLLYCACLAYLLRLVRRGEAHNQVSRFFKMVS